MRVEDHAETGMMYLVAHPGQDEDDQDQEDLDDPEDARQRAEVVATTPDRPRQKPLDTKKNQVILSQK